MAWKQLRIVKKEKMKVQGVESYLNIYIFVKTTTDQNNSKTYLK